MKKTSKFLIWITFLIVITQTITAFGVSAPFWPEHDLEMVPGDSRIVELNLQNMVGDEDVEVRAELVLGNEIAKLKKNSFTVKSKTYDTMAELEITIPPETPLGERISVKVEFRTIPAGGEGMVSMGTGMNVGFDVVTANVPMSPKDGSKFPWTITIIVTLILVTIVISLIILKRKQKQANNQALTNFK